MGVKLYAGLLGGDANLQVSFCSEVLRASNAIDYGVLALRIRLESVRA